MNNYQYDALGNLVKDKREQIDTILWTVAGKVKHISRTAGSTKPELWFTYGADGNRISKTVGDPMNGGFREWYLRDAQGNIMATYRYTNTTGAGPSLKVTERPVYGSSRIGSYTRQLELYHEPAVHAWPYLQPMQAPLKRYELTDHLGNVAAVVSGRLLPGNNTGSPYQAELVSAALHEPFGLELTGMNWQSDVARWGFQNQIKDLELNTVHFKYREYGPGDGVFTTIDPLWAKYPYWSPYAFSGNRVVDAVELEGLEPSGINPQTGVSTTANDANSNNGQWDSQLIYPSSGPSGGGADWNLAMQRLYAVDRALSGSESQFPLRTFNKERLAGGYTMVDDYATGTNNADRVGDPSGSWDVTAIKARAEASFGPEKLTSRMNPAQGEGWVGNVPEAIGSASGAISAAWDPLSPQSPTSTSDNKPVLIKVDTFYLTGNGNGMYRTDRAPGGEYFKKGDTIDISIQGVDASGKRYVREEDYHR